MTKNSTGFRFFKWNLNSTALWAALSLSYLVAFAATSIEAAQPVYEASVTLQASKILPADFL